MTRSYVLRMTRTFPFHRDQKVWIRWLHLACSLPPDHIAKVLDLDFGDVVAFITRRRRGGREPKVPTHPPRRPNRQKGIRGGIATKARTLHDLNYDAASIAGLLSIDPRTVKSYLKRISGTSGSTLIRPRTAQEQAAVDSVRRRRKRAARIANDLTKWGRRGVRWDNTNDQPPPLPPAPPPATELTTDQIGQTVVIESTPDTAANHWTGNERGPRKLKAEQISEATELLAQGHSYPSVARRFGVSVNTLRRYASDRSPRRRPSAYPTEAVFLPHGAVRWDLPLGSTSDGRSRMVRVDCDCGRQRYVETAYIKRRSEGYSARCGECRCAPPLRTPPCPAPAADALKVLADA
jgi:DNA-binding CsgD family transcriptional regulator